MSAIIDFYNALDGLKHYIINLEEENQALRRKTHELTAFKLLRQAETPEELVYRVIKHLSKTKHGNIQVMKTAIIKKTQKLNSLERNSAIEKLIENGDIEAMAEVRDKTVATFYRFLPENKS